MGNIAKVGIILTVYGVESQSGISTLQSFIRSTNVAFPNIPVRYAFTSEDKCQRIAQIERHKSDSLLKSVNKMIFEGFTHIAVQPLHIVPGTEYEDVVSKCETMRDKNHIVVGQPLIRSQDDIDDVAKKIITILPNECGANNGIPGTNDAIDKTGDAILEANDAILLAGHGSRHPSTQLIIALGEHLHRLNPHIFTALMKGSQPLEEILPQICRAGYRKLWLLPLFAMAGKHLLYDIAGDQPHSWKSQIQNAGIECIPSVRSVAEIPILANIWIQRLRGAVGELLSV